ncbi:cyclic nucleotide-binding domain-containing protein [Nocardioides insulae]|uniref:cyclic nucleotide-binding domain-containing protein n=1 Tax=Nocardioides insulae TaxID=394734 RepID=UPI0004034AF0|nr:cyclic nucleotide-binding domain-containing protein [Nocardioides insulae]
MTGYELIGAHESRLTVVRRALSNRDLRRALVAYLAFNIAEWASYICLLVWAFDRGGVRAASVMGLVQLIPAALLAPVGASLLARMTRAGALATGYAVQTAAFTVCGCMLLAEAGYPAVAVSAALAAFAVTLTRPVHNALLPEISASTAVLTGGNAASGTMEAVAVFLGPLLSGLLIVTLGPGGVLLVLAGLTALSCVGCLFLTRRPRLRPPHRGPPQPSTLQIVVRAPAARLLLLVVAAEYLLVGLIDILLVVLALDVLDMGLGGPGVLNASMGIGALAGAGLAVLLVGRRRLASAVLLGAVVAGVPLSIAGSAPVVVLAFAMLALCGGGKLFFDVALRSLVQRALPDAQLTAVFGVNEAVMMTGIAAGTAIAPGLVLLFGPQGALLAAGVLLPVVALLALPTMRRLDAEAAVPAAPLARMSQVPFLSILSGRVLERLARSVRMATVPAGHTVIREGETGEDFYIVVSGHAAVLMGGEHIRELGPGDFFGELALLRDVPRTATVRATSELEVDVLQRVPFLTAVLGTTDAVRRAEEAAEHYRYSGPGRG